MLIEERQEAFVVGRREMEQLDELPVAALGLPESSTDDFADVGLRELALDEQWMHRQPEALPSMTISFHAASAAG